MKREKTGFSLNPTQWFTHYRHSRMPTAIALGGGGARGVAHLGLLKFLEDNAYHFDMIAGTSAGAIFGALYLQSNDAEEAYDRFKHVFSETDTDYDLITESRRESSFLNSLRKTLYLGKSLFYPSVIKSEPLSRFIAELLGEKKDFEDMKIPLYVVATDLISGKDVVFHQGELHTPILASSSIPGVFPPVHHGEYLLIDGGTTQKLPSRIAFQLGAARVLGVDASSPFNLETRYENATEILIRSEEIAIKRLHHINCRSADLLLYPRMKDFHWYDFDRHEEAFDAGYTVAVQNRDQIDRFFAARRGSPLRKSSKDGDEFFLE